VLQFSGFARSRVVVGRKRDLAPEADHTLGGPVGELDLPRHGGNRNRREPRAVWPVGRFDGDEGWQALMAAVAEQVLEVVD
jgi:hypothetical protein